METLTTLKTKKISDFFKYVRETEDTMPTDGRLKKILQVQYQRFANVILDKPLLPTANALTKNDIAELRKYGHKYPAFTEIIDEMIVEPGIYPSHDIHSRFMKLLGDRSNFNLQAGSVDVRGTLDKNYRGKYDTGR